jgi:hypothetical protein
MGKARWDSEAPERFDGPAGRRVEKPQGRWGPGHPVNRENRGAGPDRQKKSAILKSSGGINAKAGEIALSGLFLVVCRVVEAPEIL